MSAQNVIVLNPRRRFAAQVQRRPIAAHVGYDIGELECSDYGRDPRLLPGWWIAPMCFLTLMGVWIGLMA